MTSNKNNKMNNSNETKNTFQEKNNDNTHNIRDTRVINTQIDNATIDEEKPKKKITIVVDEDDPCLKQEEEKREQASEFPGDDPRFQQQNQTLRCWVMYTDFYRCERILGEGTDACTWFKQVFSSICPKQWIRHWDDLRLQDKFPWHKYDSQGKFPGDKYGV